ncbi:MAG: permease [Candidatus Krumholzibacteriaceae bacterium]|jgi:uncharacterized membrane protein YraQ (UPF0718 family)
MSGIINSIWSVVSKAGYYLEGTYTHRVLATTVDLVGQLWYFFVAGILVSAVISLFWSRDAVAAFFQKSSRVSIVGAAVAGIISPMPTYVAIPLVAALFGVGVPIPVLFAFLVSSPLMNPVLFFLTAGAFGYKMALARVAAALVLGVAAGWAAFALLARDKLGDFLSAGGTGPLALAGARPRRAGRAYPAEFGREVYHLGRWAGKYFLLGIFVAALAKNLIPVGWIARSLGANRTFSVLTAVAAGVPLYACGGGTIPVMKSLQDLGLDKGAVLAFFISGPATKLSTIVALKAAVTRKVFFLYLGITLVGATAFGLLYSLS